MKYFTLFFIYLLVVVSAQSQDIESEPVNKSELNKFVPQKTTSQTLLPAVPLSMSYQGLLTTSTGTPVTDGSYTVQIELYDSLNGGTQLWTDTFTPTVTNGTFNVILGSGAPLNVVFDKQMYVQVTATAGPPGPSYPLTFSPRSVLTSAPYSLAPWSPSGDNIFYNKGNVGIGTTNPARMLHLYGSNSGQRLESTLSDIWTTTEYVTNAREWHTGVGGSTVGNDVKSKYYIFDATAVQFRMAIDISGNVGIGTTAPTQKLDVQGDMEVGNGAYPITFLNEITEIGNWGLSLSINGTDRAAIDRLGNSFFKGNVGIGIANPVAKLHVSQSGTNTTIMVEDPTARARIGMIGQPTFGNNEFGFGNIDLQFGIITDNTFAGFSEKMRITTGGNVGIGTTAPAKLLHVNGPSGSGEQQVLRLSRLGTLIGDNIAAEFLPAAGTLTVPAKIVGMATGAADVELAFHTVNAGVQSEIMRLSDDQVGIGTASPSAKFEVESNGATAAAFDRQTDDGPVILIQQAGTTEGSISVSGTTVSYNAFTGSHYGSTEEVIEAGTLVSFTGSNKRFHGNEKSEIIYGITASSRANDPACLGAYLALQESSQPEGSENPHLIMAVGNGEMWITDDGRNIEAGDYLISSDVRGHAMKDDEERFPIGHVVARAAEKVDWSSVGESFDGHKHKKISVLFGNFVRSSVTNLTKEVQELRSMVKLLVGKQQSASEKSIGELK